MNLPSFTTGAEFPAAARAHIACELPDHPKVPRSAALFSLWRAKPGAYPVYPTSPEKQEVHNE